MKTSEIKQVVNIVVNYSSDLDKIGFATRSAYSNLDRVKCRQGRWQAGRSHNSIVQAVGTGSITILRPNQSKILVYSAL